MAATTVTPTPTRTATMTTEELVGTNHRWCTRTLFEDISGLLSPSAPVFKDPVSTGELGRGSLGPMDRRLHAHSDPTTSVIPVF